MNYMGLLNKEEKVTLCIMMFTGRECKQFFKHNEQLFQFLRKGFRVKTLTEKQALLIVINNINDPDILMWFNANIEQWLTWIKEKTANLEEDGVSHNTALATVLLNSKFFINPEMYFKLTGNVPDEASRSALYAEMAGLACLMNETSDHFNCQQSFHKKV